METACRYGSKPDVYSSPIAEDVRVEVRMEGEGPRMGVDAQLKIVVKNTSSQPRRTTLHSQVAVMFYTGVLKDTVKKDTLNVELNPQEGELGFVRIGILAYKFISCSFDFFPQLQVINSYLKLYILQILHFTDF